MQEHNFLITWYKDEKNDLSGYTFLVMMYIRNRRIKQFKGSQNMSNVVAANPFYEQPGQI